MANRRTDDISEIITGTEPALEMPVDILAEFTSKNIPLESQHHFRVFCARKSAESPVNYQDASLLEKFRKEFLGITEK